MNEQQKAEKIEARKTKGLEPLRYGSNAQAVYDWWIGDKESGVPDQTVMFE